MMSAVTVTVAIRRCWGRNAVIGPRWVAGVCWVTSSISVRMAVLPGAPSI